MTIQGEKIATLEANYINICKSLDEVKESIEKLRITINGLNQYKWKIVGISIAVSAIVATIPTIIVLIKFLN